jgi:Cu(I)/Ag(I) efflux system membrane protein CusA/SilA
MVGGAERVRPKMMTVTAITAGLLPILWGGGAGASVMKRIAAPMVGGMLSSTILTLLVIPAIYSLWRQRETAPGGEVVPEPEPPGSMHPREAAVAGM